MYKQNDQNSITCDDCTYLLEYTEPNAIICDEQHPFAGGVKQKMAAPTAPRMQRIVGNILGIRFRGVVYIPVHTSILKYLVYTWYILWSTFTKKNTTGSSVY